MMNSRNLLLGLSILVLICSSCAKESMNAPNGDELPETITLSPMKFQKDIELQSVNRKNKVILSVSSDDEALLTEFSAANYSLIPLYSVSEQITDAHDNMDFENSETNLEEGRIKQPNLHYEIKVIAQEEDAVSLQLDVNTLNLNRGGTITHSYNTYDHNLTIFAAFGCGIEVDLSIRPFWFYPWRHRISETVGTTVGNCGAGVPNSVSIFGGGNQLGAVITFPCRGAYSISTW